MSDRRTLDGDTVTLVDREGRCHMFIVRWLDRDTAILSGFSRTHVVSREALEAVIGRQGATQGLYKCQNDT